jgi:hypothetical protein
MLQSILSEYCLQTLCLLCSEASTQKKEQMLALCIMHFLALENLRDANELMNIYRRSQKGRGIVLVG